MSFGVISNVVALPTPKIKFDVAGVWFPHWGGIFLLINQVLLPLATDATRVLPPGLSDDPCKTCVETVP